MRLQYIAACIAGFVLAALVPAFAYIGYASVFAGYDRGIRLLPIVLAITLAHSVAAGLPLFLIFRARDCINAASCIVGGFIAGAVPLGFFSLLSMFDRGTSSSIGGVPMVINGVPTLAGWLNYGRLLLVLGLHGALGGLVFWVALTSLTGSQTGKAGGSFRRIAAIAMAVIATGLAGSVFAIPSITREPNCHDVWLPGLKRIPEQAIFRVRIGVDEWPKLTEAVEEVRRKHKLYLRNDSLSHIVSICSERGFSILVVAQRGAADSSLDDDKVAIGIYEKTPGSGWQQPTRDLITQLESLWAGKIQFEDASGKPAPMPKDLQP